MSTIAERLKKAMDAAQMTQTELAKRTGIGKSSISTYLSGSYEPKQKNIYRMALALGVNEAWLMGADIPMARNAKEDYINNPITAQFSSPPANVIPMPNTYKVPLIGTIACGQPILAVENTDELVDVPEYIQADFALRCKGDSMINARIFDGDIVYIYRQPEVENGQIAAVRIGEEATLKKVYFTGSRLVLRAANPLYDDLEYEGPELEEVEILGKAVAFTSMIR